MVFQTRPEHQGLRASALIVEAVLYRYRAGNAWRNLPERFGDSLFDFRNPDLAYFPAKAAPSGCRFCY